MFILPHETALAKPLTFCDLQVWDPNPHQVTPADLQRDKGAPTEDEVRSLIRLLVASDEIEPSLFSCLKNTLGRVVANIGVCPSLVFGLPGKVCHESNTLYRKNTRRCGATLTLGPDFQQQHMQLTLPLRPASWPL